MSEYIMTEEHKNKISLALMGNKNGFGKTPSPEKRIRLSIANKGHKPARQTIEASIASRKNGVNLSEQVRLRRKLNFSGENNPSWKGGVTPLHILIRTSTKNINWIKEVFEQDNYTCQECFKQGGYLEAHHIKPFSEILKIFLQTYSQFSPIEDKETLLRLAITYEPFWDLLNGKTLCRKCHNKTKKGINGLQ